MKAVVAVDSFKGSLSSIEAGLAVKEGIKRVYCDAKVIVKPLGDGGEGTLDALVDQMKGEFCYVEVRGPLANKVKCRYGIIKESKTAIIEIANIVGLALIEGSKRNPMITTTYGIGEVIKDAIEKGYHRFIIALGGSSTNDGGIGMLQALGIEFLDKAGNNVSLGGQGLKELAKIDNSKMLPVLKKCKFIVACDVNNPLCGINGASRVYGLQKGADEAMIKGLDAGLMNYAKLTKSLYPQSDSTIAGSGAAGGLGFAFLTYLNAELKSGIEIILKEIKLENDLKDVDIVITGEGCLDHQTAMGKAPIGVARLAKKYNRPVIAFAGGVTNGAKECNENGIDAYFPILRNIISLDEAMDKTAAKENLADTVEQVFRLWKFKPMIEIRKYKLTDLKEIVNLYNNTVRYINCRDYNEEQLNAWTGKEVDLDNWHNRFINTYTLVALVDNKIVAFGNIDKSGYLDCLYVHHDYQGEYIATRLCDLLENKYENSKIITHASITAKSFFRNRNYQVIKEQEVDRNGVVLINYVMEKIL